MARIFADLPSPSAETIYNWQRQQPPTTPADEKLIAMVISNTKWDPTAVVEHFIQIAHTILTPAPLDPWPTPPRV